MTRGQIGRIALVAPAESDTSGKLAHRVARQIEERIINLGWPVGQVIGSEAALLEEYGVSRAVLREAIRLLEYTSIASMRRGPGGGLVVTEPDSSGIARAVALFLTYRNVSSAQLVEARSVLELAAVQMVTERIREDGVTQLRESLEQERRMLESNPQSVASNGEAASDAQPSVHQLHLTIAELSGNPIFPLFVDVLTRLNSIMLSSEHTSNSDIAEAAHETHQVHEQLVEAIVSGDASLARHRMLRHLQALMPWLQ